MWYAVKNIQPNNNDDQPTKHTKNNQTTSNPTNQQIKRTENEGNNE